MKKRVSRIALRSDTVRALTTTEIRRAAGGITMVSQMFCPATWAASCDDSCTADLRTT